MSKVITVACMFLAALLGTASQGGRFHKYRAIEAYEVRPGIIIIPTYSEDGQVCEIGLESLHYSPKTIRLDPGLSSKEIDQIFNEVVPESERGPKSTGPGDDSIEVVGNSIIQTSDYKSVSLHIYGAVQPASKKHEIVEDEIVATIDWKNRKCQ
jgi:hypothetical protein